MSKWVLRVEVNGEWEECGFTSRKEALATLAALANDYSEKLERAVLVLNRTGKHPGSRVYTDNVYGRWLN